jgi:hypothetical protein
MTAVRQRESIEALPNFRNFSHKQKRDFGLFARSLDLGKLLEIANELSWFPDCGIPDTFMRYLVNHVDSSTLAALVALFDQDANLGHTCASHVRQYRNLLHPAVCLKEGRHPSKEVGLTATFLFMIAFTSLSGVQPKPLASFLNFRASLSVASQAGMGAQPKEHGSRIKSPSRLKVRPTNIAPQKRVTDHGTADPSRHLRAVAR